MYTNPKSEMKDLLIVINLQQCYANTDIEKLTILRSARIISRSSLADCCPSYWLQYSATTSLVCDAHDYCANVVTKH